MNHASRPSSFRVGSKLRLSRSFLQTQTPPSVCVCVRARVGRFFFPSIRLSVYLFTSFHIHVFVVLVFLCVSTKASTCPPTDMSV
jgi:hypothetical protein